MKTPKIRARRLWMDVSSQNNHGLTLCHRKHDAEAPYMGHSMDGTARPVAVLDVSEPDALVDQVASLLAHLDGEDCAFDHNTHDARVVLESLNIIPKRRAKR